MRHLALLLIFIAAGVASAQPLTAPIDFRRDVVPILEARCFSCHRGAEATAYEELESSGQVRQEHSAALNRLVNCY